MPERVAPLLAFRARGIYADSCPSRSDSTAGAPPILNRILVFAVRGSLVVIYSRSRPTTDRPASHEARLVLFGAAVLISLMSLSAILLFIAGSVIHFEGHLWCFEWILSDTILWLHFVPEGFESSPRRVRIHDSGVLCVHFDAPEFSRHRFGTFHSLGLYPGTPYEWGYLDPM